MALCKAKKKDGAPCESAARASGFCFIHDPTQAKARAQARRLGGKHRRRGACGQKRDSPKRGSILFGW